MAKKGLDTTFIHYGIRKPDMGLIEAISIEHQLEFDWIKEDLLKEYHEMRISNKDITEKTTEKLIEKALQKIK
jgi:hypothetical protein